MWFRTFCHIVHSSSSECGCAVFPSSNTSLFPESCHAWNIRMGDPKSTPKHTSNARIFMTRTYLYIFLLIHLLLLWCGKYGFGWILFEKIYFLKKKFLPRQNFWNTSMRHSKLSRNVARSDSIMSKLNYTLPYHIR